MTEIAPSLAEQVEERIRYLSGIMRDVLDLKIPHPVVRYTLKGDAAGCAHFETRLLDFNPELLTDNAEEFIEHTVPHEFAHLGVDAKHGKVDFHHGREWQAMMKLFDVPPRITHTYQRKARRFHSWKCKCMMHHVSDSIHRKMKKGAEYLCVACSGPIREVPKHVFKGGPP